MAGGIPCRWGLATRKPWTEAARPGPALQPCPLSVLALTPRWAPDTGAVSREHLRCSELGLPGRTHQLGFSGCRFQQSETIGVTFPVPSPAPDLTLDFSQTIRLPSPSDLTSVGAAESPAFSAGRGVAVSAREAKGDTLLRGPALPCPSLASLPSQVKKAVKRSCAWTFDPRFALNEMRMNAVKYIDLNVESQPTHN